MDMNRTGLGVFYGIMAGALWGGIFLAPKLVPDFSALQLSTARYLTYGLISLVISGHASNKCRRGLARANG